MSELVSRGNTVAPVTLTRKTTTEIALNNGEKILISGLIEDDKSYQEQKVPILASIPVLGNLFRYKKQDRSKTNLVIFLSVRLVESDKVLSNVKGASNSTMYGKSTYDISDFDYDEDDL